MAKAKTEIKEKVNLTNKRLPEISLKTLAELQNLYANPKDVKEAGQYIYFDITHKGGLDTNWIKDDGVDVYQQGLLKVFNSSKLDYDRQIQEGVSQGSLDVWELVQNIVQDEKWVDNICGNFANDLTDKIHDKWEQFIEDTKSIRNRADIAENVESTDIKKIDTFLEELAIFIGKELGYGEDSAFYIALLENLQRAKFAQGSTVKNITANSDITKSVITNLRNAVGLNESQVVLLSNIVASLLRARKRYIDNGGKLSKSSFDGTLIHVLNTLLGENLAKNAILNISYEAEEQIVQAFDKYGKVLHPVTGGTETFGKENITSKVDVFTNNFLKFGVELDNKKIVIDGLMPINLSVKTYSQLKTGVQLPKRIKIVNDTPLFEKYIDEADYYEAGNLVAHYKSFLLEYNQMKNWLIQQNLTDWLMGTGITEDIGIDTATFLLVNGHVFPMLTILSQILENASESGNLQQSVQLELPGIGKAYNTATTRVIKKDGNTKNNSFLGWVRSEWAWDALDQITIDTHLNLASLGLT